MQKRHFAMPNKAWHDTSAESRWLLWQDGIDRGWFRTNRSALHGLPDLTPILATVREVASGMAHLHSMNILHGDLTSLNVLLASSDIDNRGFIAKVSSVTSPACVCAEWGRQQLLQHAWVNCIQMLSSQHALTLAFCKGMLVPPCSQTSNGS